MAQMAIVRAKFDPARETAFGAITANFTVIGSTFETIFYIGFIQNFTDQIMDFSISYDGLDVAFSLNPGGTFSGDMLSNGTQVSVGEAAWVRYRTTPPSSGFVQVTVVTPA